MGIKKEKTHLMMLRGEDSQKFRMKNVNLQTSSFERDLGVVILENLLWVNKQRLDATKPIETFSI